MPKHSPTTHTTHGGGSSIPWYAIILNAISEQSNDISARWSLQNGRKRQLLIDCTPGCLWGWKRGGGSVGSRIWAPEQGGGSCERLLIKSNCETIERRLCNEWVAITTAAAHMHHTLHTMRGNCHPGRLTQSDCHSDWHNVFITLSLIDWFSREPIVTLSALNRSAAHVLWQVMVVRWDGGLWAVSWPPPVVRTQACC